MIARAERIDPAATVIILRDAVEGLEALLVQREASLAFHGGAWVFPGGRIDDAELASAPPILAARRAAVRETREEAGLTLNENALVPFSHWTTPEGRTRRFATWFFVTHYQGTEPGVVDGSEIRALRWYSPAEALLAHKDSAIDLPPPTFVTLSVLESFQRAEQVVTAAQREHPRVFVPRPCPVEGGVVSLYAGDVAYDCGDPLAPGPRHRLSMLNSGFRYERTT